MIYLLDTDTLITMIRGLKARPRSPRWQAAEKLVSRCQRAQAAGDEVGLSAVTVSELEYGAQNSAQYDTEMQAVRKVLAPFVVYDYEGVSAPLHYGRIRHELESKGRTIGGMDLLIAAHALSLHATLVTSNLTHFGRATDLKSVNWLTGPASAS
jgi:tRNA(fMet)-specific endonuclease VapC